MKEFDLEIRVITFGSILTTKIFLEDSTNESNRVLDWDIHQDGYRFKKLEKYQIKDSNLDIFVACQGIEGGYVSCEVIINGKKMEKKIKAKPTDKIYAHEYYTINT
ncbi:hypothetical protein BWI96_16925 [Siphonobacter sp. SORGH_AS_0500]|uniref:hypothetical protein n=1 Tax=Siphonobacter sp. SORGH_AS_0500 TaxID=1864824 RepID=UPI000CB69444|nr:hypothetical protein [Siphonobacter sp. SORGH_AS_0500]PKK35396.1 hypothetical protein BWI96_16925 [Siphonobacter sp. SORGH_AS_0500]